MFNEKRKKIGNGKKVVEFNTAEFSKKKYRY